VTNGKSALFLTGRLVRGMGRAIMVKKKGARQDTRYPRGADCPREGGPPVKRAPESKAGRGKSCEKKFSGGGNRWAMQGYPGKRVKTKKGRRI